MGLGDFELIHWMMFLWPVPLLFLAVALYLVKRKTGLQGWRRVVPGNISAGLAWIARGVSMALGFLCRKVLKRVPWKPLLIWGPWVVIVLVVGFTLEENWRGARALERVREARTARGEKSRLEEFLPERIPAGENFAEHPMVWTIKRTTSGGWGRFGLEVKGLSEEHSAFPNGNPDLGKPEDISLWLPSPAPSADEGELVRQCLELLGQVEVEMTGLAEAVRRPECCFDLGRAGEFYLSGWFNAMGLNCVRSSYLFHARALLHVRSGDGELAMQDVETLLLLADKLAADPTPFGARLQVTAVGRASKPIWEGLRSQVWSEKQLQRLADLLGRFDFPRRVHACQQYEVTNLNQYFEELAADRGELDYYIDPLEWMIGSKTPGWWDDSVEFVETALAYGMPSGWLDQWQAELITRLDRALLRPGGVKTDRVSVEGLRALDVEVGDAAADRAGRLQVEFMEEFRREAMRSIVCQSLLDRMRIAVALERHRLRVGGYPGTLAELVPGELAMLPVDLVTGEPIRYRLKQDGTPLVYSVGFDEVDDGGVPAARPDRLDWVWQYTGTPSQTENEWRRGEKP